MWSEFYEGENIQMGKSKSQWQTKAKKRAEKPENPLAAVFRILNHFFANFHMWISEMTDPRNEAYITYTQMDLIILAILKNVCSISSMRSMDENFNEDICIENLSKLTGDVALKEIPHYDTLNYYLERLSPEELSIVRAKMIKSLISNRVFDANKLFNKHWQVILDGTGLFYFKEKHCDNCLKEVHKNDDGTIETRYYHKVLEAKLLLADNIIISLDTEFIENESENVSKQDCELNAAKRLLCRLKERYPRLNICLQGDALYAAESIMNICKSNNWKYIFTQKEGRQRAAFEAYDTLEVCDKTKVTNICSEKGTGYFYNHIEGLAGKTQVMNIFEYSYENKDKDGSIKEHHMQWLTNINLTRGKLEKIIIAGRRRWKIENEGFNVQKNILYDIQHINSRNNTAMKNHYLITQIADIIMQLYLASEKVQKTVNVTLRNIAAWILESFRKQCLTQQDIEWMKKRTSIYLQ